MKGDLFSETKVEIVILEVSKWCVCVCVCVCVCARARACLADTKSARNQMIGSFH